MSIFLSIALWGIIFGLMMMIRSQLLYKFDIKALERIHNYNTKKIKEGKLNETLDYRLVDLSGSTDRKMFTITGWTYNYFHQELEKILTSRSNNDTIS